MEQGFVQKMVDYESATIFSQSSVDIVRKAGDSAPCIRT